MVTDLPAAGTRTTRRRWLQWALAAGLLPPTAHGAAAASPAFRFAAAWDEAGPLEPGAAPRGAGTDRRWRAGVLGWQPTPQGPRLTVLSRVDLPTRAHGLWREPAGSLLVVARRPGLWLMRWREDGQVLNQVWADPGHQFNGHVLCSPDGRQVFTTEIDLATGEGCVVRRDAATLKTLAVWPTGGADPHQMLLQEAGLLVANGGIRSSAETGRAKLALDEMDASIVRLDLRDGRLLRQWRLPDPRLSLRHLAQHTGGVVGIALQAEHDAAERRQAAPVLALLDDKGLRVAEPAPALAGYGGDISATPDGFIVSAPRAGGLGQWTTSGQWRGFTELPEACALTSTDLQTCWAAGRDQVLDGIGAEPAARHDLPGVRLDNHWLAWRATSDLFGVNGLVAH
jgi:uncharacterized protein